MICSFDRVLKRHDYGFEICGKRKDVEFARTREVLRSKQIQPKNQGKGNNCHKADALSDEVMLILELGARVFKCNFSFA